MQIIILTVTFAATHNIAAAILTIAILEVVVTIVFLVMVINAVGVIVRVMTMPQDNDTRKRLQPTQMPFTVVKYQATLTRTWRF